MESLAISPSLIFSLVGLFLFIVYWAYNFVIIYHLARFGVGTLPKKLAAFFMLGSISLFFVSMTLFGALDKNAIKEKVVVIAHNIFLTYPQ